LAAIVDLNAASADQELGARTRARESLEKAIKLDPHTLNGAAQRTIARMYLDLPPLLGGDTSKALEYFAAARQAAPGDIRTLNGIAACDLELGRSGDAAVVLRQVAQLVPANEAELQLFVDEWRTGEGLATRLGDTKLASSMGGQRSKLLGAHPELLPRNSPIVLGHGGSNPVTGAKQYVGDVTRPAITGAKPPP
jgi:tetratricopeptide (TPR) repeat protein